MYVMGCEPLKGITASEVRAYFEDKPTAQDLADAYAVTHNKFWWVEDNEYDFEEGTPEHQVACDITNEWCDLMDYFKEKIFALLTSEGIDIPPTRQVEVLEPFMKKYGYKDGNGWWVKE